MRVDEDALEELVTMLVLVSVIDDGQADAAGAAASATAEEAAANDAFNDRLRAGGQLVMAEGLTPPEEAVVVDARHGDPVERSGLVAIGDEYPAGFWIWEVADFATARALAVDASRACNRTVELRAVIGERS